MHSALFSFGYKEMFSSRKFIKRFQTLTNCRLKNNVIPRGVSEHKLSSLCEQARGTLSLI